MAAGRRILLLGGAASELCLAAGMARDLGAEVRLVHETEAALASMLVEPADLMMVEVTCDVAKLVEQLRAARLTTPVLACGVNASARDAVAAVHAGAYDYIPLPPERELIAAVLHSISEASDRMVTSLVGQRMEDVERALILKTLSRCDGNRTAASHILGISVRTMRNKLRSFMDAGYPVSPAA